MRPCLAPPAAPPIAAAVVVVVAVVTAGCLFLVVAVTSSKAESLAAPTAALAFVAPVVAGVPPLATDDVDNEEKDGADNDGRELAVRDALVLAPLLLMEEGSGGA